MHLLQGYRCYLTIVQTRSFLPPPQYKVQNNNRNKRWEFTKIHHRHIRTMMDLPGRINRERQKIACYAGGHAITGTESLF